MVRTSKTDHFFKLAPFWSPLTDFIDFGMAGKLLTSATRWCFPFVDSVSRIWIKPKKSLIGCWAPTATTFGQSAPSRVQLTADRNGHNRHFEQLSLVSSVCRSLCTGKIELYVSWAAYFRGVLPWLQRMAVNPWVLHARARSREWLSRLLRQATSKKYAYAANLRLDKLADFNDGVFFERSTNSSESVNLNSAL